MKPPAFKNSAPTSYWIWVLIALVLYFALMAGFDRSLFAMRPGRIVDEPDGFQMTILDFLANSDESPIWLWARFMVIAPLLAVNELPGNGLMQAAYLLIYSFPVAIWAPPGGRRKPLLLILILIPAFISFRLAICIYSVCYCLMFIVDRRLNHWLFLWFAFVVFLSSSTMFIFLFYFPLLAVKRLQDRSWMIKLASWALYALVVSQFFDKIMALFVRSIEGEVLSTASEAGLDYSGSTGGFLMAMLTGNPFFTAISAGQYDRLLILIPSVALALILLVKLVAKGDRRVLKFISILLASMLSEGVGSYSVGVVLFIVMAHHRVFLQGRRPSYCGARSLQPPPCVQLPKMKV